MPMESIDEEMDKVITEHGAGLVAVAKAVKSMNLTLAHHTAWSRRTVRGDRPAVRARSITRRFEAIDRRFEEVDRRFDAVDARFDIMDRKIDTGHSLILGEISKLSARVEQVVAFAIRDELKVREISE